MRLDASVVGEGVRTHYVDHIAPVWTALPEEARGTLYAGPAEARHAFERYGIEAEQCGSAQDLIGRLTRGDTRRPVLVASHSDPQYTDFAGRRNIILMHGVGFTFGGGQTCYPGSSRHRANTILMLATNERIAEIERRANPRVRVEVVGCPKLDRWREFKSWPKLGPRPTIGLAFHWRCQVHQAAGTVFDEYRGVIPALAERYRLIGHGHPRIMAELAPWYEAHGIEVVADQADLFRRIDLLLADATSCIFEAAALDVPVVLLNSGGQAQADCGGMYAERMNLGVVCYRPGDIGQCVPLALADPPGVAEQRCRTAAECYANLGHATEAAVAAIIQTLGGIE